MVQEMSRSNVPAVLSRDGNYGAMEERTQGLKSESERQASQPSYAASSIVDNKEKLEYSEHNEPVAEDKPAEKPEETVTYAKGAEAVFVMLALLLSITLCSLDQTIVATAIPKITDQFRQLNDISWYGSAYFLTLGAFQSQWGKIYKYFPLKTSFLVAIFIFELGSLICAVAPNSTTLIVGRAISGVGGSGIVPGVYTIAALSAEPTKRATYMGVIGVSYGFAAVIGPLIGGAIAGSTTWRWCFWINLPVGGLAALVIFITFKTPSAAKLVQATLKEKFLNMDFPATVLIMGASTALILALQYGGVTHPWNSSIVIGLLVGFVVIVLALTVLEIWQGERAMLTPRLLLQRSVWVNCAWGFFFTGGYFVTLYYLPIYFQSIDNASPISSGVRNIPLIALLSIATVGSGLLTTKTGIAAPYLLASSVITTIGSGLLFTLDIGTPTGQWVGYQILTGFGYGLGFQIPVVIAQTFSAPSDLAPVTAIVIFFRSMGATFLLAAAEAGFANQLVARLAITAPSVDPAAVTATGATKLREEFAGPELDGIMQAYAWAIQVAFAITIAACGLSVIFALFTRWDNVNAKKADTVTQAKEAEA